jgi:glyoxylase-like metal-dependent hydrolase (beta-lactamase superfamily II)
MNTSFVGDTGRTDLPDLDKTGENAGILYDSIYARIAPLGDQTLLCPAHGAGSACGGNISDRDDSTLGIEKGTNPVFKQSRSEFVARPAAPVAGAIPRSAAEGISAAHEGRTGDRHPVSGSFCRRAHRIVLQHLARRRTGLRRLGR